MFPINFLPRVSIDVIVPVYNGAPFLRETLESVINQTFPPEQLIIVDDGSTDDSFRISQDFKRRYGHRIPITILQQPNRGLSSARNAGIAAAKSAWVAFLDADDLWLPQKLALQAQQCLSLPSEHTVGLIYCDVSWIDATGRSIQNPLAAKLDQHNQGSLYTRLLTANIIPGSGSTVLVHRECFKTVGNFDTGLNACEDWDFTLRLAKSYAIEYVPQKLVLIRKHTKSMSHNHAKMFFAGLAVLLKQVSQDPGEPNVYPYIRRYILFTPPQRLWNTFYSWDSWRKIFFLLKSHSLRLRDALYVSLGLPALWVYIGMKKLTVHYKKI